VLVVFMCNHCPYVRHIVDALSELAEEYQEKGVAIVGISSNDVENYPDDSPEKMKQFAEEHGFSFPYLYDESQDVAKAFRAACTPDFFLFDENHKLYYRGQFDGSRPKNASVGCNIKWKPGNEPDYFG